MRNMAPKIALDTNILVYATDIESPFHHTCRQILVSGLAEDYQLFLVDKTIYELYAVLSNTIFKSQPERAIGTCDFYITHTKLNILNASPNTIRSVSGLVKRSHKKGKYIHDLVLAAIILENDVNTLVTMNAPDFEGLPGLEVVGPESFIQS